MVVRKSSCEKKKENIMNTYIGTYQDMIERTVELILAAAEKIHNKDAISRIYTANREVDTKIGNIMENIRKKKRS